MALTGIHLVPFMLSCVFKYRWLARGLVSIVSRIQGFRINYDYYSLKRESYRTAKESYDNNMTHFSSLSLQWEYAV